MFHDEAGIIGDVLQNLTHVHRMLQPQPMQAQQAQHGVCPEETVEDASQLLQLFLFPNSTNLDDLNTDNIQVCAIWINLANVC